jgi:hypothetical protein
MPLQDPREPAQHGRIVFGDLKAPDRQPDKLGSQVERRSQGIPCPRRRVAELTGVYSVGNDSQQMAGDDAVGDESISRGLADDGHLVNQAIGQPVGSHTEAAPLVDVVNGRDQGWKPGKEAYNPSHEVGVNHVAM